VVEPATLEAYLHEHIPVSQHLGISAVQTEPGQVRLMAPLQPNLNHRQTAFGGSISAIAILSGWSLIWVRLQGMTEGHRIVIHSNTMSYLAPVRDDFEATCEAPTEKAWEIFMRMFTKHGRARIELAATVRSQGEIVAEFQGKYVVFRPGAFD
jgi:thioesterase domain-containing protein